MTAMRSLHGLIELPVAELACTLTLGGLAVLLTAAQHTRQPQATPYLIDIESWPSQQLG